MLENMKILTGELAVVERLEKLLYLELLGLKDIAAAVAEKPSRMMSRRIGNIEAILFNAKFELEKEIEELKRNR